MYIHDSKKKTPGVKSYFKGYKANHSEYGMLQALLFYRKWFLLICHKPDVKTDERLPEEYGKCLVGLNAILREAWNTAHNTEYKREKIQALSLAKDCYSMKLELLTNASVGNVFHTKDIEAAIEKGRNYDPDNFTPFYSFTSRSMGIDPAYGSSAFGVVVTEWADGIVQIMHAEEYHRPDYNEMLSLVYGLMSKYNVDSVYIDGANPSFIYH